MFNISASTLVASLIWGSVGVGFCIFGKKQQETVFLIAGIFLLAISYMVASALYMSLASVAVIALSFWLNRRM